MLIFLPDAIFCFVSILFNCNLFIKFLIWWIQYEMDIYVCCQLIVGVKMIGWRHALTIRIITIYNMLYPFERSKTSSIFCSFFVSRTLNHCKLYFISFWEHLTIYIAHSNWRIFQCRSFFVEIKFQVNCKNIAHHKKKVRKERTTTTTHKNKCASNV